MKNLIAELCSTTFMPHGQCYLWNPTLLWLHVIADSLITLAYFSIPITILYFIRHRRDIPFPLIFVMFGVFIVSCGTTHLIEVWTVWEPHYWIAGGVKAFTAAMSLVTAGALVKVVPVALTIPSAAELQRLNVSLEERVAARTAELTEANGQLRREITQREQAESEVRRLNDALQVRLAELQALFDLLPVGVGIAADAGCREIRTNRALASMLGLPQNRNASLSAPLEEAPHNFRVEQNGRELAASELPIQRAIAEGTTIVNFEETIVRDDGVTIDLLANAVPIRDQSGQISGCVATFQDLTEHKRGENQRLALERKLLETQKLESLGVLAGGIAHDFNNILTGILGNSSLAAMEIPVGSPAHDNLHLITQSSIRAADLCTQMLACAGKGRFVIQKLDLNRLISETTHLLQISISKKAVMRFNLSPELPPIEADATQMRQVIMNLVINASEAIGEKSGVIGISTGLTRVDRAYLGGTIHAPEVPEGDYVSVEISDTGSGMSPETQARIFEPFFTTKFTGRGLGLAAVQGIMRGHKGALKVYSEPGRGSTFKLLFPFSTGLADDQGPALPSPLTWRGSGRVLVADDEETVRITAGAMLRKLGFEVALVADGKEAVAAFQAAPGDYTLVLLDLTMPHLDGAQTFKELRRIRADARVILMSGFNEQEAIAHFTGKGLASFVQKPFNFDSLSSVLQSVLGKERT